LLHVVAVDRVGDDDFTEPTRIATRRPSRPYPVRTRGGILVANESNRRTAAREAFGDVAPALAEYTDDVLFGDVWERPGLSKRDRSLITVATLIALYRTNELPFHLKRALENGVTKDELVELMTHLAFYAGWPTASTAVAIARKVFDDAGI
jgi:4-carboxymuconolactone decarboxylase